jgi:NAD(P)H-hydrate epimerase
MTLLPVLTSAEAASWDAAARTVHGIPSRVLMDAAGRAAARIVAERADGDALQRGALIACGSGNNGGDGWVVARALAATGIDVAVAALEPKTPDAAANRTLAMLGGVRELARDEAWPASGLAIDALLGTGASGPVRGEVERLAAKLVAHGAPIVAIDGPTGLDLSTGEAHGPVRAELTITFGGARRGHLLAREWCGDVIVVDIGFPPADASWPACLSDRWASGTLPPLAVDAHKGERGRVLVVGGAAGMSGAALHACSAAFAAGAGLVRLVASEETVVAARASAPDVLTTISALEAPLEPEVREAAAWADAVVAGPGLGRGPTRLEFLGELLDAAERGVLLDADALTIAGGARAGLVARLAGREAVLTPHVGEFRALFPELDDLAGRDRWAATRDAAAIAKAVVLLKGVPTVIADPAGPIRVAAAGNPGLATGGSGDLLAGLIGAFLARGLPAVAAAGLGAHALGRAAELVAMDRTARALRPADLLRRFPELWRQWASPAVGTPPMLAEFPHPAVT